MLDAILAALRCDEMNVAEPTLVCDVVDGTCDDAFSVSTSFDFSFDGASADAAWRPPKVIL